MSWIDPISIFTGLLVLVTGGLVYVGWRQNQSTRTIERAYIKMSHVSPGLIRAPLSFFDIQFQIENFGRTPGTVTDEVINYKALNTDELLPAIPEYSRDRKSLIHVFLVSGEKYFSKIIGKIELDIITFDSVVRAGTKLLYIYGYIDYIDKFGIRHRSGYARVFRPDRDNPAVYGSVEEFNQRNNLDIVVQAGYNYDRHRTKGEGKDWD